MESVLADKIPEQELADELDMHRETLARMRRARKGPPFIELKRRIYYRRAAVEKWLESLEQEQPRAGRGAA